MIIWISDHNHGMIPSWFRDFCMIAINWKQCKKNSAFSNLVALRNKTQKQFETHRIEVSSMKRFSQSARNDVPIDVQHYLIYLNKCLVVFVTGEGRKFQQIVHNHIHVLYSDSFYGHHGWWHTITGSPTYVYMYVGMCIISIAHWLVITRLIHFV